MLLISFLLLLEGIESRPDEINGELVGYNYVFGLELYHYDELLEGITFGECVERCDTRDLCKSLSYLKNDVGVCKIFPHATVEKQGCFA